ncbi:MAG: isoamylase early set domain-containing protein [Gemmatimonadota bacterium]|nr:isoamylase early set domain-containing protein [Gemmatimonadota bacterium]
MNDESLTDRRIGDDDWERMIAAFRQSAPHSSGAPPWLETRVMAEIEALPEKGSLARALEWLVRPAPIRVSPLVGVAALALFALVLTVPRGSLGPSGAGPDGVAAGTEPDNETVVYVQFVLDAPSATSVAVAGDFSEWQPAFSLDDVDGDGVWTGRVPVEPGVHTYMFLIDGTRWETDPRAERYSDDGFGNKNAVLAVAAGA